jgi:hypothetical protein
VTYESLIPTIQAMLGDTTGAVYPEADITSALQASYGYLVLKGFEGTYTTDTTQITPDPPMFDRMLFCLAVACILIGGKLSDPSTALSVKTEGTAIDGGDGAEMLTKRMADLEGQLYSALRNSTSAVIGHDTTAGLVLPDDSPIDGAWDD